MRPCRFCGGDADPALHRLKKGYVCRACCRQHVWTRDNHTAACIASRAKYEQTPRGLARKKQRLFIGQQYIGKAQTPELAGVINTHIKERRGAFKRLASRAEA